MQISLTECYVMLYKENIKKKLFGGASLIVGCTWMPGP